MAINMETDYFDLLFNRKRKLTSLFGVSKMMIRSYKCVFCYKVCFAKTSEEFYLKVQSGDILFSCKKCDRRFTFKKWIFKSVPKGTKHTKSFSCKQNVCH